MVGWWLVVGVVHVLKCEMILLLFCSVLFVFFFLGEEGGEEVVRN